MLFKILGGVNNYVIFVIFIYFILFLKFYWLIFVIYNGKLLFFLFVYVKIVVFINKDDEIKYVSYCLFVVCKYFILKLRVDIGVINWIFNIIIEYIRMFFEKKLGCELFELIFKCIVYVNIIY